MLLPSGPETQFSYGHHMVTVPMPQSLLVLREVSVRGGSVEHKCTIVSILISLVSRRLHPLLSHPFSSVASHSLLGLPLINIKTDHLIGNGSSFFFFFPSSSSPPPPPLYFPIFFYHLQASPSPYDLVKFHLEHPTTYQCRSYPEPAGVVMPTDVSMPVSFSCIPVKITLQNCSLHRVKVGGHTVGRCGWPTCERGCGQWLLPVYSKYGTKYIT